MTILYLKKIYLRRSIIIIIIISYSPKWTALEVTPNHEINLVNTDACLSFITSCSMRILRKGQTSHVLLKVASINIFHQNCCPHATEIFHRIFTEQDVLHFAAGVLSWVKFIKFAVKPKIFPPFTFQKKNPTERLLLIVRCYFRFSDVQL